MVVLTAMMMYVNILQNTISSENVCMYIHSWECLELSRSWELKEIQLVHPKGNQPWIFFGRTDAEAEALILWPPDAEHRLIGKGPDIGKDGKQEEKGTKADEMVGWHHWLDGHAFEQAPGVGHGQRSLMCCTPWDYKELDMTDREGNGTPLQDSCLENPMDGGAW